MKVKELTFYKEMKIGLPSFSNITVGHGMTVEVEEGEDVDKSKVWDAINQQLSIQAGGIDPSWIETREYGKFFRTTIKTTKGNGEGSDKNG